MAEYSQLAENDVLNELNGKLSDAVIRFRGVSCRIIHFYRIQDMCHPFSGFSRPRTGEYLIDGGNIAVMLNKWPSSGKERRDTWPRTVRRYKTIFDRRNEI